MRHEISSTDNSKTYVDLDDLQKKKADDVYSNFALHGKRGRYVYLFPVYIEQLEQTFGFNYTTTISKKLVKLLEIKDIIGWSPEIREYIEENYVEYLV